MKLYSKISVLVLVLVLAAQPVQSVLAAAPMEETAPPEVNDERLENIWARELRAYERFGQLFENADDRIEHAGELLDRADEKGLDTSALRTALADFEAAIKKAKPIYESANGIVNSHQGFDTEGKVSDHDKAVETVQELGGKLKEIRDTLSEPAKALREALRAFREDRRANRSTSGAVVPE